jgi:peptide/nickel transport system permease protein
MPLFWLSLLLVTFFSINTTFLPPEAPQGSFVEVLRNPTGLVLPIAALTLITLALFSRYMRSSAIDSLTQDYVRTARAKGAGPWRVMRSHVLRNAMLPVVTILGMDLGLALGGAFFTETVFGLPGLGKLAVGAIDNFDLPTTQGVVVFATTCILILSLAVDMLYAWIDPRIRLT